jgi:hypothetical protein
MNKLTFIFLLLLTPTLSYSYENQLALKGGIGAVYSKINTTEYPEPENRELLYAGALSSSFSYRYINWEFGLNSYIFMGKVTSIKYQDAQGNKIIGKGRVRSTTFGPMAKYITSYKVKKIWRPYLSLGPLWGMQTINLSQYQVQNGTFHKDYKIVYDSRGYFVAIGFEEDLEYKEMNPVFIELAYTYQRAYNTSIVDASNYTAVRTLNSRDIKSKIFGNIFIFNFGITFF